MKLGSMEFLEEVKKRTNEDEKHGRLAKNETDSYTMMLKAEPDKGVQSDIVIGYQMVEGKITEVWEGEKKTDFILRARYGVWVDILRGHLNAVKALSLRKLKVKGNFLKLLKGSASTERWVEILQSIPTEFDGEYSQYNTTGS
ncbi:MAG: SCP2 sterol-binding domain-containing protein [Actinobacteria bacterium]|nr:SCP2 sterol-binding domain-containing protein [Actinomycetota bacterium]